MKHLKMLGLAAIAALGLMAFVGAGTASATKLCTDSACKTVWPTGTEIKSSLSGGTAKLTGSGGEVLDTCTGSTVAGKTSNESGASVSGNIESLTWSNCTVTTDTVTPGKLEIKQIGTENKGEVFGSGSEVTVNLGVSCTYGTGGGTKLGTITGGESPVLHIEAIKLTKTAGGFLCPSNPGWDADYTVTAPHAIFIGS